MSTTWQQIRAAVAATRSAYAEARALPLPLQVPLEDLAEQLYLLTPPL